eukprot:NODE_8150_length_382_cov_4.137255_g7984_i0.p2 GENE.NODE_8150_length_382_cov_4.137255_g7984_i0~~NODE_8150_length_382_cov_4.137255_g7984_i0.p2  ORF type:complete len:121 (-),score=23.58 NODE_8150_length_382_cov_4.137255_g7984_i0:20-331(-)
MGQLHTVPREPAIAPTIDPSIPTSSLPPYQQYLRQQQERERQAQQTAAFYGHPAEAGATFGVPLAQVGPQSYQGHTPEPSNSMWSQPPPQGVPVMQGTPCGGG